MSGLVANQQCAASQLTASIMQHDTDTIISIGKDLETSSISKT